MVYGYKLTQDEEVLANELKIGIFYDPMKHDDTMKAKRIWCGNESIKP